MTIVRVVVLALAIVGFSACSETRTYHDSNGRCIVHDTNRVLGVPLDQQEWDCPKPDQK